MINPVRNNFKFPVFALLILLIISVICAISIGSVSIATNEIYEMILCFSNSSCDIQSSNWQIIWELRLPRALMAMITGAGLALSGTILQTITRNPLADPYLLGISSGAALGAVVSMAISTLILWLNLPITMGALAGAIFSLFLMLTLAGRHAFKVERLLLSGVAVSFMLSAFTSLILYYSAPDVSATLLFWMMGSFSHIQWQNLALPFVMVTLGLMIGLIYRNWIAAIQTGDDSALSLGVPVNSLRLSLLIISAIITGTLVAQVGGIAFVGLMIPHIARMIVGSVFHKVFISAFLLGSIFLIWVDIIARTVFENQVLPVGIVTAAIGSVFFFIILRNKNA
ncbi:MAG: iron ABC transporter permease [Gammaproteobacteria bacterium]|nr:iron ABC transporter permease [Gammaproteobacteria bacterium]